MESLALVVAVVFLAVLTSGPLAATAVLHGYPYLGGTLGAVASMLGVWWAYTVRGQVAWVGLLSAGMGIWAVLQAYRHNAAQ